MKRFQVPARWTLIMAAMLIGLGCASQQTYDFTPKDHPTIVMVYEFHASPGTPFEDPRLAAHGAKDFSAAEPDARQAAIGDLIRTRVRNRLIDGISAMGMTVQAGDPTIPAPAGALLIRGEFTAGSPDNRQLRNVVLFEKDKAIVDTGVYAMGVVTQDNLRPLLHLLTHAESKPMPAATRRGETSQTLESYRPQIDELADETADQALSGLSVYLANQGWISPSQVRPATYSQR